MTTRTFLIIGGTGTVGSSLAPSLARAGATARIASRQPQTQPVRPGIEAVRLDLQAKETFAPALAGVDGVFVLSPPGHVGQDQLLRPFLEAAIAHGKKIVTMTANGVQFDDNNPMRLFEKQVSSSSVPFVHLRPGWFMQNFQTFWLPSIKKDGVIALPAGDAVTAFVDARDIAEVAARALLTADLDGQSLALTGPAALTYAQAAQVLSKASERKVGYTPIDDDTFTKALLQAGLPADYARLMVELFATVRQGFASQVDDTVSKLLGRARSLEEYARDNAAVWR